MKIGFIGLGNMATAMIGGMLQKGITKPEDIIKDPYVFEFLGLPEEKPFLESGLEAAFVRQIEDFLLEFGRALCLSAHSSGSP